MALHSIKKQQGFTLLELIVVIIVISILGLFAIDRIWVLRIAAEQAAVSQIVGNIRSALGLEVAKLALAGDISAVAKLDKTNPVPLLAQVPNNYLGEKDNDHGMTEAGVWYYDKQLQMLVYNVLYSENLASPLTGVARIRYQLKLVFNDQNKNNRFDPHHDSIGGLDLFPVESYQWNNTAKINYE